MQCDSAVGPNNGIFPIPKLATALHLVTYLCTVCSMASVTPCTQCSSPPSPTLLMFTTGNLWTWAGSTWRTVQLQSTSAVQCSYSPPVQSGYWLSLQCGYSPQVQYIYSPNRYTRLENLAWSHSVF